MARYRVTMQGSNVQAVTEIQAGPGESGTLILELDSATPIAVDNAEGIIPAVVGCLGMGEEFGAIVQLFASK
jgi:hypothetical protein